MHTVIRRRGWGAVCAGLLLCLAGNAQAAVVINEIYPTGGNSGATYSNDFVELYNNSATTAVLMSGWTLQYFTAAGTSPTNTVSLPTTTLQPQHYFLVVGSTGGGTGTATLPPADATGGFNANSTTGKFKLFNGATLVDLVGYGSSASEFEGASFAPSPSNAQSSISRTNGIDTDNNNLDFTNGSPPTPAPEPATLGVVGVAGLMLLARRRSRG